MTESRIFELLLEKQYDFPELHEGAAGALADSFANIIYDTLSVKSTAATTKRLNILQFLHSLAATPGDPHVAVTENNYKVFLGACEKQLDVDEFKELELQRGDLCSEVVEFHRRKRERRLKTARRIELMRKHDQGLLDEKGFPARVVRNTSCYETSEVVITNLIVATPVTPQTPDDLTYRKKQIKFGYALLHLKQWPQVNKLLCRLSKYQTLTRQEINFLEYLNEHVGDGGHHLRDTLVEKFIFIYEKALIEVCTEIVRVDERDVGGLLEDSRIMVIKKLCRDNKFRLKIIHMLYQLYVYSCCNRGLLQLIDLFR